MDELVQRLSEGDHPIIASRADNVEEFKQSIDRGYVLLKFTDTRGGTELGIRLDESMTDMSGGDLEKGTGSVRLGGTLILNYVRVNFIADIDLTTLKGKGHLEIIEEVQPGQV